MADYSEKEDKVLDKVADTVNKLDDSLNQLDALDNDPDKTHKVKEWFLEKKALHEIRKVLYEAGKYEDYTEDELIDEAEFIETYNLY